MSTLAEEMARYQSAVQAAQYAGMPPPAPPATAVAPQQATPAQSSAPTPREVRAKQQAKVSSVGDLAQSLWTKAVRVPVPVDESSGMISYARIPEHIRRAVTEKYREIGEREPSWGGWDPRELDARERALLLQLVGKGDAARSQKTMSPIDEMRAQRRVLVQEPEPEKVKPWVQSSQWPKG